VISRDHSFDDAPQLTEQDVARDAVVAAFGDDEGRPRLVGSTCSMCIAAPLRSTDRAPLERPPALLEIAADPPHQTDVGSVRRRLMSI